MKKSSKKTIQTIIAMLFISVIIVAAYYFVRTGEGFDFTVSKGESTQAELLMEEDIINNYPSTPKEVLELYIKISKSFYEKNTTDEQIEKLSAQMLLLFDDELLEQNPSEIFKVNLKNEINRFRDENIHVMNYLTGNNDEAEFWTKDDREYASRIVTYTLKEGSKYTKVFNTFILRRNDEGKWKILGWTSENPPSKVDEKD